MIRRLVVLASLLCACAALPAAAQAAPKTVIFRMFADPLEKPERLAFFANSGPSLVELGWDRWGEASAVGTGTWLLDCSGGGSSCGASNAVTRYPARLTFSRLRACPRLGAGVTTYTRGTVEIDEPAGTRTQDFDPDPDYCVKAPTVKTARAAVTKRLRSRGGKRITVTCEGAETNSRTCKARYTTRKGRRATATYIVVARLEAGLLLTPLG